ncbi:hypothetical protein L917_06922, partial [Phytophthora nicotianae]
PSSLVTTTTKVTLTWWARARRPSASRRVRTWVASWRMCCPPPPRARLKVPRSRSRPSVCRLCRSATWWRRSSTRRSRCVTSTTRRTRRSSTRTLRPSSRPSSRKVVVWPARSRRYRRAWPSSSRTGTPPSTSPSSLKCCLYGVAYVQLQEL